MTQNHKDIDPQETQEWLESIDDALEEHGFERARFLLEELIDYAQAKGARLPFNTNTPFINTIQPVDEPDYPGDKEIERKIKSIIRWNAMAMVVRANTNTPGIGGHISTYASSANLYEVAFNHFLKVQTTRVVVTWFFSKDTDLQGNILELFLKEGLQKKI